MASRKASTSGKKPLAPMNNFLYDLLLWLFSVLVDLFFREVHPRSSWKIPRKGPVIFVAAPHANQFVDPLILMRVIRKEAQRRISFLIAEKSMSRKFIGWFARNVGAVPVGRAMDMTKAAEGKIYLPDAEGDPLLVRGVDTKFDGPQFQVGGLLVLPTVDGVTANAEIAEICGPEEIRLKKPFKGSVALKQLTGRDDILENGKLQGENKGPASEYEGISFKAAPKVDQTQVYDAVFERLNKGGCVGIFPEGGSHDRPELLPLKAGVAIMALGALAANPDCGLKIIPCGMNYFHAHKFRSRAVIEFGTPVEVSAELIDLYKKGERREAVSQLLETIYQALVTVTVTTPDYDTLMLIQAVRRLYNPKGKKLPLPMVVELNRRLVKGYARYKDDERIVNLKKSVLDYNKNLMMLNVRDHQVEYAEFSWFKVIFTLLYRIDKLMLLLGGTLPGLILFSPVFIAGKLISIKKSQEALAASTVKIQGKDVMATWKLLVSMALAPALYTFYTVLLTYWTYKTRVHGHVPEAVPLWAVVVFGYMFFPTITFAALRFGEVGMDIFKSLRPLALCLNPTTSGTFYQIRQKRTELAAEVTELINTLGPEMFPDFDHNRIVADPFTEGAIQPPKTPTYAAAQGQLKRTSSDHFDSNPSTPIDASHTHSLNHRNSISSAALPRNESFHNLGNIGLFASRPTTPSRSRTSSTSGFPIHGFSTLNGDGSFDEVTKKIQLEMRKRGQRRRSQPSRDGYQGWDEGGSGATTPGSEGR